MYFEENHIFTQAQRKYYFHNFIGFLGWEVLNELHYDERYYDNFFDVLMFKFDIFILYKDHRKRFANESPNNYKSSLTVHIIYISKYF